MLSDHSPYVVILIGLPGSGKTLGSSYIEEEFGFASFSAGDILRELCSEKSLPTTRENLSKFGQALIKEHGYEYFANLLWNRAKDHPRVIIEGIRPPEVVRWLQKTIDQTLIIFIDTSESLRLSRLASRGEDVAKFKEIIKTPMEHNIANFRPLADVVVKNEGDVDLFYCELKKNVSNFLKSSKIV